MMAIIVIVQSLMIICKISGAWNLPWTQVFIPLYILLSILVGGLFQLWYARRQINVDKRLEEIKEEIRKERESENK